MDVTVGPLHDHCRFLDASGAYEWWYTDALSPDGEWGVVVILFRGMPMSPDYLKAQHHHAHPIDHCGYAASIYHRGKRVFFAFRSLPPIDFSTAPITIDLGSVGCYDQDVIEIDSAVDDLRRSAKITLRITGRITQGITDRITQGITGRITGRITDRITGRITQGITQRITGRITSRTSSETYSETYSKTTSKTHGWVLANPRTRCAVSLSIREGGVECASASWEGYAYRDHNWGERALQHDFIHWYWGRVHAPDRCIVYLAAPGSDGGSVWAGEVDNDGNVQEWTDVVVTPRKHGLTLLALWAPRHITITGRTASGEVVTVESRHQTVIEDSPFYQRYLSRWTLNGADLGQGTSEYMNVSRYKRAWIRPFLRLPWFRHG